jgi:DNA-binding NarL/FixJ family response regulator
MPMTSRIRVLCVDDHSVVRDGIAALIDMERDMEVVASAATGEEAVQLFQRHRPDVTLMDLQLPGISGFAAIRAICDLDPAARIIVLTMHRGDVDISKAQGAGACAYLLKSTLSDNLIRAIREVHAGGTAVGEMTPSHVHKRSSRTPLTPREEDVIRLVGDGLRNKEIASSLGISEETVQAHIKKIFAKLEVHDRTAALAVAIRRGIVRID